MPDIFLEPLDPPVSPVPLGSAGQGPVNAMSFLGEGWVPQDVRRRRRQNLETMRRLGTPVVVKHMYSDRDVKNGDARRSPSMDSVYDQVRHDDPLSYGVGFVGIEDASDEWYDTRTGEIIISASDPGTGYLRAPMYRGFGQGYLTWIIEPDVAEDMFKLTDAGVMVQTQTATAQAPWFPEINDNDLLINVIIGRDGRITATEERYQAKMTNPVTMRGHQRRGRREGTEDGGNRFMIGQSFEMTLIPRTDILYDVPVDR
jgi:hypothetical protein